MRCSQYYQPACSLTTTVSIPLQWLVEGAVLRGGAAASVGARVRAQLPHQVRPRRGEDTKSAFFCILR